MSTPVESLAEREREFMFETVFSSPLPIREGKLQVSLSRGHQRVPVPELDGHCIDSTWEKLTQQKRQIAEDVQRANAPSDQDKDGDALDGEDTENRIAGHPTASVVLFNEFKFRLHDAGLTESDGSVTPTPATPPPSGAEEDAVSGRTVPAVGSPSTQCVLKLGITDYKVSIGTTVNVAAYEKHVAAQEADSVSTRVKTLDSAASRLVERHLANALGVEALTVTSDNQAVLFRRSPHVGEFPGYYCCPGGHPEPKRVLNTEAFIAAKVGGDTEDHVHTAVCDWFQYVRNDVTVNELFVSVVEEVCEELGVSIECCSNVGIVSLVRNRETRKPDLCFIVRVGISSEEVLRVFNERHAVDAYESVEGSLVFVDLNKVNTPQAIVAFVNEHFDGKVTPASFGALYHGIKCYPF